MTVCPCGSNVEFDACCGPLLDGSPAPTAEALMRSRFSAFVKGNMDHIERTHAETADEPFDRADIETQSSSVQWVELEILNTTGGQVGDDVGTVEFAAHFLQDGKRFVHHENSTFRRENGNWMYVDGIVTAHQPPVRVEKVGRNEPCPCGSGKKYKKCCGA